MHRLHLGEIVLDSEEPKRYLVSFGNVTLHDAERRCVTLQQQGENRWELREATYACREGKGGARDDWRCELTRRELSSLMVWGPGERRLQISTLRERRRTPRVSLDRWHVCCDGVGALSRFARCGSPVVSACRRCFRACSTRGSSHEILARRGAHTAVVCVVARVERTVVVPRRASARETAVCLALLQSVRSYRSRP